MRVLAVYPRVHGGTGERCGVPGICAGLSPRARGNQGLEMSVPFWVGSIPACTGEPVRGGRSRCWPGVYPRVHGGTRGSARTRSPDLGLSPRARGNRAAGCRKNKRPRSIPACTGEPAESVRAGRRRRVYPRVHGGTTSRPATPAPATGLSPRARGNRSSSTSVTHR